MSFSAHPPPVFCLWGGKQFLGSHEGVYPRKHGRNVPTATVADLPELWGRAKPCKTSKGIICNACGRKGCTDRQKKKNAVFT
jgi:hypothetical protein